MTLCVVWSSHYDSSEKHDVYYGTDEINGEFHRVVKVLMLLFNKYGGFYSGNMIIDACLPLDKYK